VADQEADLTGALETSRKSQSPADPAGTQDQDPPAGQLRCIAEETIQVRIVASDRPLVRAGNGIDRPDLFGQGIDPLQAGLDHLLVRNRDIQACESLQIFRQAAGDFLRRDCQQFIRARQTSQRHQTLMDLGGQAMSERIA